MVEEIFLLILKTSLYASVVGIVILTLKAVLRNKINPKWHYIIWAVLILKLLIPFGPQSALSLFNSVPEIPEQTNFTQMYEDYHKNYNAIGEGDKVHVPTTWVLKNSSLQLAATAQKTLPYIWLFGVAVMLGWLLFTNYSLNRKVKSSSHLLPDSIYNVFEDCKIKIGVKKDVKVILQNSIDTPSIFNVFKPKILLSPNILTLSEKEISYILLHELAHYKRRDLMTNHLLLLLQMIHWFNPVLWYCFKRMRQDMEVAADELVLTQLESGEQREYGKALLAVVENLNVPRLAPRLIGMVDDKKNIEKRIKMIKMMDFFKNRRKTTITIGVLCVAVLSSVLLTNGLTKDNPMEEQTKEAVEDNMKEVETQLNNPSLKLIVSPDEYYTSNSAMPGISISAFYTGMADKVEYSTNIGMLFTWESPDGKVNKHGQKVVLPIDENVYWGPFVNEGYPEENLVTDKEDFITVNAIVFNKNDMVAQKQVSIKFNDTNYAYKVIPSEDIVIPNAISNYHSHKPKSIDEAVRLAIKEQRYSRGQGEAFTEGHIILDTEEKDGIINVYTLASYGEYGFENRIFTMISGCGLTPTVLTFEKSQNSEYSLIGYKEALDGAGYIESTKKMFPERLWDTVLNQKKDKYSDLVRQQEEQAKQYLKSIGRNAEVKRWVDKKSVEIDVEASNKIFGEYIKYDLINFPNWIGTKELIQNGIRYIYETSQSKSEDGYDIINFKKTKEDGTVVIEYTYKIVGHEPKLISQ